MSFPPVADGYVRIFTDHTGRWYEDIPQEEYDKTKNDPLFLSLQESITEEINKEIIENLKAKH